MRTQGLGENPNSLVRMGSARGSHLQRRDLLHDVQEYRVDQCGHGLGVDVAG